MRTLFLKGLVLSLTLAITLNAVGQQSIRRINPSSPKLGLTKEAMILRALNEKESVSKPSGTGSAVRTKRVQSSCDTTSLGYSINPYTLISGARNNLWANPILNTITMTRRGGPGDLGAGGGTGNNIFYDLSTNGGRNWTVGKGPLYNPDLVPGTPPANARYPQGGILNPQGNTNPANAYQVTFTATTNGAGWNGMGIGAARMDANNSNSSQEWLDQLGDAKRYITEAMAILPNGTVYLLDPERGNIATDDPAYTGDLVIYKGEINNQGNFGVVSTKLPLPLANYANSGIAFDPSGTIGYIVLLGHDNTVVNDEVFHPIVLKTTDGGTTWGEPLSINLNDDPMLQAVRDSLFGDEEDFDNGTFRMQYSTAFDNDITVDRDGSLHILTGVMVAGWEDGTNNAAYSVQPGNGQVMWDIIVRDNGAVVPLFLGRTKTFRGCYYCGDASAEFTEDNRPQTSRSWDGSKIVFAWFDTDTILFPPQDISSPNSNPDLHMAGISLSSTPGTPGRYATDMDITGPTPFVGLNILANVSPFSFNLSGDSIFVPMSYAVLDELSDVSPMKHVYNTCFRFDASRFTLPLPFPTETHANHELKSNATVFFPNPSTGSGTFRILTSTAQLVEIKLNNVLGQEVFATKLNTVSGAKEFAVDFGTLPKGIYTFNLKGSSINSSGRIVID